MTSVIMDATADDEFLARKMEYKGGVVGISPMGVGEDKEEK